MYLIEFFSSPLILLEWRFLHAFLYTLGPCAVPGDQYSDLIWCQIEPFLEFLMALFCLKHPICFCNCYAKMWLCIYSNIVRFNYFSCSTPWKQHFNFYCQPASPANCGENCNEKDAVGAIAQHFWQNSIRLWEMGPSSWHLASQGVSSPARWKCKQKSCIMI